MGFEIAVGAEEEFLNEDRTWLGTRKGTLDLRSITLDPSLFTADHTSAKGALPSGTAVGKVTATGLYGPYDDTAIDGREVAAGLTFTTTKLDQVNNAPTGAALYWNGVVVEANLPTPAGGETSGVIDAAAKTDLGSWIRWE